MQIPSKGAEIVQSMYLWWHLEYAVMTVQVYPVPEGSSEFVQLAGPVEVKFTTEHDPRDKANEVCEALVKEAAAAYQKRLTDIQALQNKYLALEA